MEVRVDADGVVLDGILLMAPSPRGVVVFAHGSGSGRHSSRNVRVAEALTQRGFASLLFDLLTDAEERRDRSDAALRFDIALLAGRLAGAVAWVRRDVPAVAGLPVGLFGASTGAAAALVAAAREPAAVRAVVSRGGRPDLAGDALGGVSCPVLLVVGGADDRVLELNRQAATRLSAPHEVSVVPGAGHLFDEPGALEQVQDAAATWFERHLSEGAG